VRHRNREPRKLDYKLRRREGLSMTGRSVSQACHLYEEINTDKRTGKAPQAPDLSNAKASAGAYFSSWGTWASEKRKGWGTKTPVSSPPPEDIKRAEDFKREKDAAVGDTPASPPPQDIKRRSLFFDAEKDKEAVGKE
jgi:hypothetical protein